jgi:hypothetical protein
MFCFLKSDCGHNYLDYLPEKQRGSRKDYDKTLELPENARRLFTG